MEHDTREPDGRSEQRGSLLRRRIIIAVDALLVIVVAVLLFQRAAPQAMAAMGFGRDRGPAPVFALQSLTGDTVSLESLRGQVVLVNFWASWCPPCRVEMPGFERVYRENAGNGFTILGIATDSNQRDRIQEFVTERDITYPILLGTMDVIRAYGGVDALPESFLVDRDGRIRHRVIGFFAEPALRKAVGNLLAEE
ncbi:MAG TPA: TlpA disulfide reductase family protein [Longimicrobiales bacterium]|nr:TlpA disulfide reductase family protein [Longimicrobiales bacterium]